MASGQNLNLISNDMADLHLQGIVVDDDIDPAPENIPYEETQSVNDYNCKSEGIICPRQSNNLHNNYAAFKNYSREEVMKMTKLELFLFISC